MFAIDLEKTQQATEKLGRDNATFLKEYIAERDTYFDTMAPEQLKSEHVIKALKLWSEQKNEIGKIAKAVEHVCNTYTLLMACTELGMSMPVHKTDHATNIKVMLNTRRTCHHVLGDMLDTPHAAKVDLDDMPPELKEALLKALKGALGEGKNPNS